MVIEERKKPMTATQNPMANTWTKAGKVRRAFKAGRPPSKDRVLTPIAAIHETCILLDSLRNAMAGAGLSPDDISAGLVLVTPETPGSEDVVYTLRIPQPDKLPELFTSVAEIQSIGEILPLGIVVHQIDREAYDPADPKSGAVLWVHTFLTGERAVRALKAARADCGTGKTQLFD